MNLAEDEKYMRRVLALAAAGKGLASPNPLVGALIVKNGEIVAEGLHKEFGGDHAELNAIKNARAKKRNLKGATLYVNLEPCSHLAKKTPPCVNEILRSGISRVVIAVRDPNPLVNGKGMAMLKKAGIQVTSGPLKKEAAALNEKFFKWMRTGLPFVGMKVAMSLDGKIATRSGDSKWITSEKSRKRVRRLRDSYDAILIGINTLIKDNPRLAGAKKEPKRIVLDSKLRIDLKSDFLRDRNLLIVTTKIAPRAKIELLKRNGYEIKIYPEKINIAALLRHLAKKEISSVLVEGGSQIFGSFVDLKLVDRFYWFIAPKIIGGTDSKNAVSGQGARNLAKVMNLKDCNINKIGKDFLVEAKPVFSACP